MSFLDELNDVQRKAVTTTEGPVMIVAGPGSGKTRVLTYRIAYLLDQGVKPWNVVALTFTNKAAREMRERIETLIGPDARYVQAGTFHSIFARILRQHADKLDFPRDFTIYDKQDSINVIKSILSELSLDPKVYNPSSVAARISSAKTNLIPPNKYEQHEDLMAEDRAMRRPFFYQIYRRYMVRNHHSGAMDFDDLLYYLFWLFRQHPDVLEQYRQRFQYVLVDEFQDTNHLQYAILKQLSLYEGSPENICVVGDDAQSIYAFRGATIDNILNFEKDFPAVKTFKLEQNYRSTAHIVKAANALIKHNKRQIPKEIWTEQADGERIRVVRAMTDGEEAKRVADLLLEIKNRHHIPNKEFAILYRTNAQSRSFEEYLRRFGIAYRVYGGTSFYQRKEVKDLLAYLKLAVNPHDSEAFRRVVNYPKRGIGPVTVNRLGTYAAQEGLSLWDAIEGTSLSPRAGENLRQFKMLISEFHKKVNTQAPAELARHIFQRTGLRMELLQDNSIEGKGRMENVQELLNSIQAYQDNEAVDVIEADTEKKTLAGFLQNISLLTDADTEDGDDNKVTLMSVHSAKGLEFQVVFVTGLEEKLFPSHMAMDDPRQLDEERRLFYVAITRAKSMLILSYAESRYRFGQVIYNTPSRFLGEIPQPLTDVSVFDRPFGEQKVTAKTTPTKFRPFRHKKPPKRHIPNFKPSPPEAIREGVTVLHEYFGKGKVLSINGQNDKRVATIFFEEMEHPERRLMLKFAKLQVIS